MVETLNCWRDYYTLLKPRVVYLVVFTAFVGLIVSASSSELNSLGLFFVGTVALICTALGSGAAGALNMWYDSDIDLLMYRTKNRPIPAGRVTRDSVLELGISLALISVVIMSVFVNFLAALILLVSIVFYVYIYTFWLKRRTPQNIVIGGAAGAFPPIIGCAAMTNSISVDSLILFTIIFLWTPPHFWALAMDNYLDYGKAGVPMLPSVYGEEHTVKSVIIYTLLLIVSTWLYSIFGSGKLFYTVTSNILNMKLISHLISFYEDHNSNSRSMFIFSILYLFSLFALIVFDNLLSSCCSL